MKALSTQYNSLRASVLLLLVLLLASSCEVGRVAPNAGDLGLNRDNDGLVTDDEFRPFVVSVVAYEQCNLVGDFQTVTHESECEKDNLATKTYFNKSGLRFLVNTNKPVHFDESRQGNLVLNNLEFAEEGAENFQLQPVTIKQRVDEVTGETSQEFVEVDNPKKDAKYSYFTTRQYIGALVPRKAENSEKDEGPFSIGIPAGMFYDINPNGDKIYNKAGEAAFNYDNVPPQLIIRFDADSMNFDTPAMSSSANDYDGLGYDFSDIAMTLDWQETVEPVANVNNMLASRTPGSQLMTISCDGCSNAPNPYNGTPPYNGGVALGGNANGVKFTGSNSPTNSKYFFDLYETDISGDSLIRLLEARELTFTIYKEKFRDLAGNLNSATTIYNVIVDREKPQIYSITVSTIGDAVPGTVNSNQKVLNIGDSIRFDVVYTEPVTVPDYNKHGFSLGLGSNSFVQAQLIPSERSKSGTYKRQWTYSYIVPEGIGSNAVNATVNGVQDIAGEQYSGDNIDGSGLIVSSWTSDISYLLSTTSTNLFDNVLLPLQEFRDVSLDHSLFYNDSGTNLNRLHIDAMRPELVPDGVELLSKIMSGSTNEVTNTVVEGQKIAVAVPYSEIIRNSLATNGIDFANLPGSNPLRHASVRVSFCTNVATDESDCEKLRASEYLSYDQALTASAKTNSLVSSFRNRTIVFSRQIEASMLGVSSIAVGHITMPKNSSVLELKDFTDLARNRFDDSAITTSGSTQTMPLEAIINIGIEGSGFAVRNVKLFIKDSSGELVPANENSATNYRYNISNNELYAQVEVNHELSNIPTGNNGTLTLRVSGVGGTVHDVTSDNVRIFADSSGNLVKNKMLFYFNLTNSDDREYEDYNGISVQKLTLNNPQVFTNRFSSILNPALKNISTAFANLVTIDTLKPDCSTTRLTTNSNGSAASYPLRLGLRDNPQYKQTIYFAVDCDQKIFYENHPDNATIKPFIPLVIDTFDQILTYKNLTNNSRTIVFSYDIVPGLTSNGTLRVGDLNEKVINWHLAGDNREGALPQSHQFFVDQGGNSLNLSGIPLDSGYFINKNLHLEDETPAPTDGVILDTRLYPITITHTDSSTGYQDNYIDNNNGTIYIAGDAPNNKISFTADYGYYYNNAVEKASLIAPNTNNVSGDVLDSSNANLGTYIPDTIEGSVITYSSVMSSGSKNNVAVGSLSNSLTSYNADGAPYQVFSVPVYDANGKKTNDPVLSYIPIVAPLTSYTGVNVTNVLPSLVINNIEPQIENVRLFYDGTSGMVELSTAGGNSDVYYGNLYLLVDFNKPMKDENLSSTYPAMWIQNAAGDITIDHSDLVYQPQTSVASLFTGNELSSDIIVYKFIYAKRDYLGTGIKVNVGSTTDFIKEKQLGAIDNLKDIYGNKYKAIAVSEKLYPVTLDARSDIESASFNNSRYKYGETIELAVKTDTRIDTSGLSSSQALVMDLQLYKNEADAGRTLQTIQAKALQNNVADTTPDGSDANGYTTITFSYELTGKDNQFNADVTSDQGVQPVGSIKLCNLVSGNIDTSSCGTYTANKREANGSIGAQAVLILTTTPKASVNSILNKLVVDNTADFDTSGIFNSMQYDNSGSVANWNTSVQLEEGDTIYFRTTPTLHDYSPDAVNAARTNSLTGSSSSSNLRFGIFNGIENKKVTRTADFHSLAGSVITWSYTIQAGDLVHLTDSDGNYVDYKINSTDTLSTGEDQALSFDLSDMFTETTGSLINGITDSIYSNPLYDVVFESDNSTEATATLNVSGNELRIDTRPRVVSAAAPSAITASVGNTVTFNLRFDKEVIASGIQLVLTNGTTDITADLVATAPADRKNVPFSFTVPDIPSGDLSVDSIVLNNGYVRYYDQTSGGLTRLNANPSILANSIHLDDVTIDNDKPIITSVALISPTGIYGKNATNKNLELEFTFSKDVTHDQLDTPSDLRLKVDLNQYNGPDVLPHYLTLITTSLTNRKLRLGLDVSEDVGTSIDDKNGMAASNGLLLAGGTITDSAGNNALLTLTSALQSTIAGFDVTIDNAAPYMQGLMFDVSTNQGYTNIGDKCNSGYACAGKNAIAIMSVMFNEPVTYDNTTAANYPLTLDRDGTTVTALPQGLTASSADSFNYQLNIGTAQYTFNTSFDKSLVAKNLTPATGNSIMDAAGNVFADTNLFNITGENSITTLAIDTISPTITTLEFEDGVYINNDTISLAVEFDEDITADPAGSNIGVELASLTDTTTDVSFDLAGYKTVGGVADKSRLDFTFTVDASTDPTRYKSARHHSYISFANIPTDLYENTADITIAAGAADAGVVINPLNEIYLENVVIKDQGNSSVPTNRTELFTGSGTTLAFEVNFSKAVDFASGTRDTANEVYLSFNADSTTDELKAIYQSGAGGKTLLFLMDIPDDIEDKDGIELNSSKTTIWNSSDTKNKLVDLVNSSNKAPLGLSNKFDNDTDDDDRLESIRIDTLAPEALTSATFSDTSSDGSVLTTKLSLTPSGTRDEDIVKYIVHLVEHTSDTSDPYSSNVPSNISYPYKEIETYLNPESTSDYFVTENIDIGTAMVNNQSCKNIYARVYTVDSVNQVSSNYVTTSYPLNFSTSLTLNSLSASGDTTWDVFSQLTNAPQLQTVTAQDSCGVSQAVSFFITYVDATGDTQTLVADSSADDYATATSSLVLTPYQTYTTTFTTRNHTGSTAQKAHNWTAYTKELPIWYDLSDSNTLITFGTNNRINGVRNKGGGHTIADGVTSRAPANFDLGAPSSVDSYTNVGPLYDSTKKAAVYPKSTTERASLHFDHDEQNDVANTSLNKRVNITDAVNGDGMTVYMVVTTPGYNLSPGRYVRTQETSIASDPYQPLWFISSGGYYDTNELFGTTNDSFASIAGNITYQGIYPGRITDAFDINNGRRFYKNRGEYKIGSKLLISYTFTRTGSGTYSACRYVNKVADGCNTVTILNNGLSIDKLYLGGLPRSSNGTRDAVSYSGVNNGGMALHEFFIYGEVHATNDRVSIEDSLVAKWNIQRNITSVASGFSLTVGSMAFNQKRSTSTHDAISTLNCYQGAGSAAGIRFPQISIKNFPASLATKKIHIVAQQDRAGDNVGGVGELLLMNGSAVSGNVNINANNNGSGAFPTYTGIGDFEVKKPWDGACHFKGINEYSYAVYLSDNALTAATLEDIDTIAEFESTYAASLTHKHITRTTYSTYGEPIAVYSLRRVVADAYRAVNITRGTNTAVAKDFGFFSSGDFEEQIMHQWVGAATQRNGFVRIWYNQMGDYTPHPYNLISGSVNRRPIIKENGVSPRIATNNKTAIRNAIRFDSSALHYLVSNNSSNPIPNTNHAYVFLVHQMRDLDNREVFTLSYPNTNTNNSIRGRITWGNNFVRWDISRATYSSNLQSGTGTSIDYRHSNITRGFQFSFNFSPRANDQTIYRQGTVIARRTPHNDVTSRMPLQFNRISLGKRSSTGDLSPGNMFLGEVIVYTSDEELRRADIGLNQMQYYNAP